MRYQAAALCDAGEAYGTEANMAKLLCADASWEAANACLQTHGGFGFAAEYDVERKFRETRLYQVAPISTNLILSHVGEHVLGLPRSILDFWEAPGQKRDYHCVFAIKSCRFCFGLLCCNEA